MTENLIQFAMCGSAGKYNPYEAVASLSRQRILLLINSAPRSVEKIADELDLSREEVVEGLQMLKKFGLVKDVNGQYSPAFAIFLLEERPILDRLISRFSRAVQKIIQNRVRDVKNLINELSCSRRGLKFSDLEYIIVGAVTLDYGGLRVLKDEKLLCPGKKMPGGGNYVFSGVESGFVDLKNLWIWGHNSTFGKYWFSTHGRLPPEGRRMAFPDIAGQWTDLVQLSRINTEMEKIGEILEVLSREDMSIRDLKAKLSVKEDRLLTQLTLLWALRYVVLEGKKWKINRPFFTPEDFEKIGGLSDSILKELAQSFEMERSRILRLYSKTSSSKNGVPFEEAFNQLYHLIFGQSLDALIENRVIGSPLVRQDKGCYSPFIAFAKDCLV